MNATKTSTTGVAHYERRFFGMIVLAWLGLAIVFNVLHRALPQPQKPASNGAITRSGQEVSPTTADGAGSENRGGN
jgi:hypothetical protein